MKLSTLYEGKAVEFNESMMHFVDEVSKKLLIVLDRIADKKTWDECEEKWQYSQLSRIQRIKNLFKKKKRKTKENSTAFEIIIHHDEIKTEKYGDKRVVVMIVGVNTKLYLETKGVMYPAKNPVIKLFVTSHDMSHWKPGDRSRIQMNSFRPIISSLTHELTHCFDPKLDRNSNQSHKNAEWMRKGDKNADSRVPGEYENIPWEQDAFMNQYSIMLVRKLKKRGKSKEWFRREMHKKLWDNDYDVASTISKLKENYKGKALKRALNTLYQNTMKFL